MDTSVNEMEVPVSETSFNKEFISLELHIFFIYKF